MQESQVQAARKGRRDRVAGRMEPQWSRTTRGSQVPTFPAETSGPFWPAPIFTPSRSPPANPRPSLADRRSIALSAVLCVLLALSLWSQRGSAGDGGASSGRGQESLRSETARAKWSAPGRCGLRTSHLGVGPLSQEQDQPTSGGDAVLRQIRKVS